MKKRFIFIAIFVVSCFISLLYFNGFTKEGSKLEDTSQKKMVMERSFSMMLETESGSGEYKPANQNKWPTEGYIFNETLSKCENGSTLVWNEDKKTISKKGSLPDRCMIYFDKYAPPVVNSVNSSTTYNSIKLTAVVTEGTKDIYKYYYSIDDGNSYSESTTNTFTFSNLSENTPYKIKVKVMDILKKESNVYQTTITTDTYVLPKVTNVNTTSGSSYITLTVTGQNGTGTINKYYYSKDNGSSYVESTSSSYTFSGLTSNTTYYLKVYVSDSNGRSSSVYSITAKTSSITLASYVISQYGGTQGRNNIYYHDGSLTNGISDYSYRYVGASGDVDNYVCINSTETTCSDANLFRIIGVFGNQVKLIKATSIGDMAWNDSGTNTWSSASLNTYLNYDYLSALGNFAENYIATTTWKVGGDTYDKIYYNVTPITAYTNEITSPAAATTVSKKIGLMYVSDYYYAASQTYWSKVGYSTSGSSYDYRAATGSNWLYLGSHEWLITPVSDSSYSAFSVFSSGHASYNNVADGLAVRPVFYLTSSVKYASGSGTSSNPIRLSL